LNIDNLKCRKCGADLHEDQKVCLQCGERTVRGGGFEYGGKQPWRPTPAQLKIAGGVIGVLLIIIIALSLRTAPPDQVAGEWFEAVVDRRMRVVRDLSTSGLIEQLEASPAGLMAVCDNYNDQVSMNEAKISEPKLVSASGRSAKVAIELTYAAGGGAQVNIELVKEGRCWKVSSVT